MITIRFPFGVPNRVIAEACKNFDDGIKQAVAVREFNRGQVPAIQPNGLGVWITEAECKTGQAAPKPSAKKLARDMEQAAFDRWMEKTLPSGDVDAVQSLWLASDDYADLLAEIESKPVVLTEGDALADLNGTRRPDNHTEPAPVADAEGWIAHDGGLCPVIEFTTVDVRMRGGELRQNMCATNSLFKNNGEPTYDVLAYRVRA